MISEALQRPLGPLVAWQWGVVIGGGYLGYRLLTGKSVFPSGGASSTTTGTTTTNATGGITQGPQGDPGPPGPAGPTGASGTTTVVVTKSVAEQIASLQAGIAKLTKDIAINKKAGKKAAMATDQASLAKDEAALHNLLNPPTVTPGAASTPATISSLVNPPSTTVENAAPVQAGLMMPAQSTAVTVSSAPFKSSTLPVTSGTG